MEMLQVVVVFDHSNTSSSLSASHNPRYCYMQTHKAATSTCAFPRRRPQKQNTMPIRSPASAALMHAKPRKEYIAPQRMPPCQSQSLISYAR